VIRWRCWPRCFPTEWLSLVMGEVERMANDPLPVAQRAPRVAALGARAGRAKRTEEAIVVATGAPRERGCPPWVVLGVKAVEARGIRKLT
jgi:hypothetical protein